MFIIKEIEKSQRDFINPFRIAVINRKNKLLYSVPYRPKTNAIESWFNQFKHYFQLQNSGIPYDELIKMLKNNKKDTKNILSELYEIYLH